MEAKENQKQIHHIFCSFKIGSMEVALPVDTIQEVVNYPTAITQIPLSPDYIRGVFDLRGLIIPIADMHVLLKTNKQASADAKVVIISFQGIRIGLLFDSTSEILKVKSEEVCRFDYVDGKKGVITGALKLNEGKRILQIVDPESLISLERIPHIVDKIKIMGGSVDAKKQNEKRKQCITFLSGKINMAFSMECISEVIKFSPLEPGFIEYDYSLGLLNLRGSLIPIIHFAKYLDSKVDIPTDLEDKKIILLKTNQSRRLGLLVDSVESILSYVDSDFLPITNLTTIQKNLFRAIIHKKDQEVVLLDHESVAKDEEIIQIVEGHARLFKEDEKHNLVTKKVQRQVFISFKVGGTFSLPINDIREIVNYPEQFINPPGAKSYVTGIFNLREKVITVVDMRKLYGIDHPVEDAERKVLIIEKGQDSYGLVVDCIDQILTINVEDKFAASGNLATNTEKLLNLDMKELVLVCDKKTNTDTKLIVLDREKILSRLMSA